MPPTPVTSPTRRFVVTRIDAGVSNPQKTRMQAGAVGERIATRCRGISSLQNKRPGEKEGTT